MADAVDDSENVTSQGSKNFANQSAHNLEEQQQIAGSETKVIFRIRIVAAAVMIVSMTCMALSVYHYVSSTEEQDFENDFDQASFKLLETVGIVLASTLKSVDTLAVEMVSFGSFSQDGWPFVTMPDSAVRIAKLLSQTKATVVTTYPLVSTEQRAKWENFSVTFDDWVDEGIAVQNGYENFKGKNVTEWNAYPVIHGNEGPVEGNGKISSTKPYIPCQSSASLNCTFLFSSKTGPYLPTWQSFPVVPVWAPYNWDILHSEVLGPTLQTVLETKNVVIGTTLNLIDVTDTVSVESANDTRIWMEGYLGENNGAEEPLTAFYYPILRSSNQSVILADDTPLVGVIAMTLSWRHLIENILPEVWHDIYVVFENDCNQTFTYRVDGPDATYVGEGDLHDEKFDYLMVSMDIIFSVK